MKNFLIWYKICKFWYKHLQEQNTDSQPDTITSDNNIAPSKLSSLKTTNYITFVDKLHIVNTVNM